MSKIGDAIPSNNPSSLEPDYNPVKDFQPINLSEIETVKPIEFFIGTEKKGFIAKGYKQMFYGASGSGKTNITLRACTALAAGIKSVFEMPTLGRPIKIIYFALEENKNAILRRMKPILKEFDFTDEQKNNIQSNLFFYHTFDNTWKNISKQIAEEKFELIIIDTLRSFTDGNINESEQAKRDLERFDLVNDFEDESASVLFIAHHNRKDTFAGSRTYMDLARHFIDIEYDKKNKNNKVSVEKTNVAVPGVTLFNYYFTEDYEMVIENPVNKIKETVKDKITLAILQSNLQKTNGIFNPSKLLCFFDEEEMPSEYYIKSRVEELVRGTGATMKSFDKKDDIVDWAGKHVKGKRAYIISQEILL